MKTLVFQLFQLLDQQPEPADKWALLKKIAVAIRTEIIEAYSPNKIDVIVLAATCRRVIEKYLPEYVKKTNQDQKSLINRWFDYGESVKPPFATTEEEIVGELALGQIFSAFAAQKNVFDGEQLRFSEQDKKVDDEANELLKESKKRERKNNFFAVLDRAAKSFSPEKYMENEDLYLQFKEAVGNKLALVEAKAKLRDINLDFNDPREQINQFNRQLIDPISKIAGIGLAERVFATTHYYQQLFNQYVKHHPAITQEQLKKKRDQWIKYLDAASKKYEEKEQYDFISIIPALYELDLGGDRVSEEKLTKKQEELIEAVKFVGLDTLPGTQGKMSYPFVAKRDEINAILMDIKNPPEDQLLAMFDLLDRGAAASREHKEEYNRNISIKKKIIAQDSYKFWNSIQTAGLPEDDPFLHNMLLMQQSILKLAVDTLAADKKAEADKKAVDKKAVDEKVAYEPPAASDLVPLMSAIFRRVLAKYTEGLTSAQRAEKSKQWEEYLTEASDVIPGKESYALITLSASIKSSFDALSSQQGKASHKKEREELSKAEKIAEKILSELKFDEKDTTSFEMKFSFTEMAIAERDLKVFCEERLKLIKAALREKIEFRKDAKKMVLDEKSWEEHIRRLAVVDEAKHESFQDIRKQEYGENIQETKETKETVFLRKCGDEYRAVHKLKRILEKKDAMLWEKLANFHRVFHKPKIANAFKNSLVAGGASFLENVGKVLAVIGATLGGLILGGVTAFWTGPAAYRLLFSQDRYFVEPVQEKLKDVPLPKASGKRR